MRAALHALALGAFVAVAACGSKPAAAPSTASTAAAPGTETAPTAAPGASAAPADKDAPSDAKPSMDSQREPFMAGCMKKVQAPDYCECGWDQFRQIFKDVDLSRDLSDDDPHFVALHDKTTSICAAKLPEDLVKDGFTSGCVGGEKRKAAYCACAWPALRKKLSLVDFIGDFQGPRFQEAKASMVAACKGKFPAELAKSDFIAACSKDDPSAKGKCACVWGKIRAKYSTEEVAAGMADLATVPGLDTCK